MDKKKRKEAIVGEYMAGGVTLRELDAKYGVNFRTIHRWVKGLPKGDLPTDAVIKRMRQGATLGPEKMPSDVKQLQRELHEARLYNKLLDAMIDIAEEQMGIPIRKKSGAKR